jgi:V8-like Glu-specific endopeptidase
MITAGAQHDVLARRVGPGAERGGRRVRLGPGVHPHAGEGHADFGRVDPPAILGGQKPGHRTVADQRGSGLSGSVGLGGHRRRVALTPLPLAHDPQSTTRGAAVRRLRHVDTLSPMLRTITAGAAAGLLALSLSATPAQAIANGEEVPEGQYTFSVKLTMTGIPTADGGKRNSGCSGALISARWIVTAGHCFRDANGVRVERPVADVTTADVGRTDVTDTSHGIQTTIVAVRQSPTADVAVAQLAEPVHGVRPISLGNSAPKIGAIVRVTGYGSTTSTNPTPVTHLRTGQLKVVALSDNEVGLNGYAPQPDTTPCPYDSGAPYFVERGKLWPRLVAVVSNGPSCPHTQIENGARTDNITPWIRDVIRSGS